MERTNSLSDLLMEEFSDLLDADRQLVEALPKMAQASESSGLRSALDEYLKITNEQLNRLQDIFNNIGQHPQGVICNAMKGLIAQSEDAINSTEKSSARDAAIINVAQRMEEYAIDKYKTAREHAADLGHTKIVELFTKTLNEQRAMNFHLNELAQYMINIQATNPFGSHQQPIDQQVLDSKNKGGGFYMPKGKFSRGGIKKKSKNTDISRFISEGNPNIQEPQEKEEKRDKNLRDPEGQGDLS